MGGPDFELRSTALDASLLGPISREIYLHILGIAGASEETLDYNLRIAKRSVQVMVGGAAEALLLNTGNSARDKMRLVLRDRKGFIRVAMLAGGRPVVPVLGYGENSFLQQISPRDAGYILSKMQSGLQKVSGVSVPILKPQLPSTTPQLVSVYGGTLDTRVWEKDLINVGHELKGIIHFPLSRENLLDE